MAITNLENAASVVINIIKQSEISFRDGAQFNDILAFLGEISAVEMVWKNKAALADEWKNKTSADTQTLLVFVDTNLVLQNKSAEAKIKAAIAAFIADATLIGLFINRTPIAPIVNPVTP